ncbi:MAG TPA: hypothetical protein VK043_11675 [Burkholderiales bacterium]|nr:hypothetical protein [Burkholderiales bacterium]
MRPIRIPTAEELYALEQQAQRVRAEELGRLTRAAVRRIREGFQAILARKPARPAASQVRREVRHA